MNLHVVFIVHIRNSWYIEIINCLQVVKTIDSTMKKHLPLLATCPTFKCDEILCFWVDKQKMC